MGAGYLKIGAALREVDRANQIVPSSDKKHDASV